MNMFNCFRDLMVFGDDIGTVKSANMYSENYCSVKGTDKEGNQFELSLLFERISDCEKINKEENEK